MQVNHEARAAAAEKRRDRTRSRLIDAAMRVVADKGAEAVSVSDIAAAAGLSRGAFYNYFPHPDDLVVAVADKMTADLDRELAVEIAEVDDPAERIACACVKFIDKGIEDPIWGWARMRLDGAAAPPHALVQERFLALFQSAVETGRFDPASAMAAMSLALGSLRMAVRLALTTDLETPPDLGAETMILVMVGLGMPRQEARAMLARVRARQGRA